MALHKTLEVWEKASSGTQSLVHANPCKHFTSSEANASQNQEQLKRESFQATRELSKMNQKSSALALEVRLIMRADLLALLSLSFISQVR